MGSAQSYLVVDLYVVRSDGEDNYRELFYADEESDDLQGIVRKWKELSSTQDYSYVSVSVSNEDFEFVEERFAKFYEEVRNQCAGIPPVLFNKFAVSARVHVDEFTPSGQQERFEEWMSKILEAAHGVQFTRGKQVKEEDEQERKKKEKEKEREKAVQIGEKEKGEEEDEDEDDAAEHYPKQILFGNVRLELDWIDSNSSDEDIEAFFQDYKRSAQNLCRIEGDFIFFKEWSAATFSRLEVFKESMRMETTHLILFARDPNARIIAAFASVRNYQYIRRLVVDKLCTHYHYKRAYYASSRPLGYILLDEVVCRYYEDIICSNNEPTLLTLLPLDDLRPYYRKWARPDYENKDLFFWGKFNLFDDHVLLNMVFIQPEDIPKIRKITTKSALYGVCEHPNGACALRRGSKVARTRPMKEVQFGKTRLVFSYITGASSDKDIEDFYRYYKTGESGMCVNKDNQREDFSQLADEDFETLDLFIDHILGYDKHTRFSYLLDPAEKRIAAIAKMTEDPYTGDFHIKVVCAHNAYKRLAHASARFIGHLLLDEILCTLRPLLLREENPIILSMVPIDELQRYYTSWMPPDLIIRHHFYWGLLNKMQPDRLRIALGLTRSPTPEEMLIFFPTSHLIEYFVVGGCAPHTPASPEKSSNFLWA